MSERPLHILFAPSLREGPWRQAITAAAQAKGLSVGVWGGEPADVVLVDHLEPDQLDGLTPSLRTMRIVRDDACRGCSVPA